MALFSPGIEPGTFCVLDRCDNHYTTKTCWTWKQDLKRSCLSCVLTTKLIDWLHKFGTKSIEKWHLNLLQSNNFQICCFRWVWIHKISVTQFHYLFKMGQPVALNTSDFSKSVKLLKMFQWYYHNTLKFPMPYDFQQISWVILSTYKTVYV